LRLLSGFVTPLEKSARLSGEQSEDGRAERHDKGINVPRAFGSSGKDEHARKRNDPGIVFTAINSPRS